MGRFVTGLGLALCLAGCTWGPEVAIQTDEVACFAGGETGTTAPLMADAEHGTTFDGHPVVWPKGYTARRVGTEVVVLDGAGGVKATTGRIYHISHALSLRLGMGDDSAFVAAVECGYEWDFIDCTANPGNPYCRLD